MAVTTISNEMASFTIRHRAICKTRTCKYKGDWQNIADKAYEDADRHMQEPGKETHIVDILTEQSTRIRFRK